MQHTRRGSALVLAVVLGASWLTVSSCDDDPADPLDPPAPPAEVEPTVQPQGDGVPLEPGSNLPPSGTTGDMPDSSGPPATG